MGQWYVTLTVLIICSYLSISGNCLNLSISGKFFLLRSPFENMSLLKIACIWGCFLLFLVSNFGGITCHLKEEC